MTDSSIQKSFGVIPPEKRNKRPEIQQPIQLSMFGVPENIDEAIEYAAELQKRQCCYGTTEGDGRPCDCKFLQGPNQGSSEATGCCEARGLHRFLTLLKAKGEAQA